MVILSQGEFFERLAGLYQSVKQSGTVSVSGKLIQSKKVAKEFREDAIASGETCILYRAYRSGCTSKKKGKISTMVTADNHSVFQTMLSDVLRCNVEGLEKRQKIRRRAKASE